MEIRLIFSGLVSAAPGLGVWIAALVLSCVLINKGGGRTSHFLLAGSILMLVSTLLSTPKPAIVNYFTLNGLSAISIGAVISYINLFLGLISLAGVICLFYAIWKKFNEQTEDTAIDYEKKDDK